VYLIRLFAKSTERRHDVKATYIGFFNDLPDRSRIVLIEGGQLLSSLLS
jgi:hypothetical protein